MFVNIKTNVCVVSSVAWMWIDSVFDFLFIIDIVINFHTTYVGPEGTTVIFIANIRVKKEPSENWKKEILIAHQL